MLSNHRVRTVSPVALLLASRCASAAVVYVDRNAPFGGNNGSSWSKAFLTIQAGVNAAQPGDEVWVAKGVYIENVRVALRLALYGGFSGTEAALGERNPRANVTTVAGDAMEPVMGCTGGQAVVSGFRIVGESVGVSAIGANTISLTVQDCLIQTRDTGIRVSAPSAVITGNVIEGSGGVDAGADTLVINGNTVSGAGIGVTAYGPAVSETSATIINNTITGNVCFCQPALAHFDGESWPTPNVCLV